MPSVKLVAGLGNPGPRYLLTRHNVGFMVIDRLSEQLGIALKNKPFFEGECGRAKDVVLLKPQTFMNLSGQSVQKVCQYYGIDEMLIVVDDIYIPFGALQMREKGSAGGHNGLRHLIEKFGSDFHRLKVGIGDPPEHVDLGDYVISRFGKEELEKLPSIVEDAAQVCETWLHEGFQKAATRTGRK